jgi:hypothetical protein
MTKVEKCDCRKGYVTDLVHYRTIRGEEMVSFVCAPCAGWLLGLNLRDAKHTPLR